MTSLKNKAINGIKWTALSSIINAILQLLQLMILARYLSAADFGIIAILMVIVGFSQVFVDFGLSKAIIYKKKITSKQLDTLYWLNIILAFLIFTLIYFLSEYIANFYNQEILSKYIILISLSIIIQAFGQQFRTLFQKELKFDILAKIDIIAAFISFISAIVLALNNYGVYSLIYPVLVITSIKSVLLLFYGLKVHKIGFSFNLNEVKEFLSFGSYTVGNGIVSTIATKIDIIIIGKLLGTETLGLYSIIKELILKPAELINPVIIKVAFPTMSKVNDDIIAVKRIYLKLINYVASINFPIYFVSALLAPEIITIFLGEKWLNGVFIFQILAFWAMIRSIGNPVGSLVMALGKPQYEMYWNIFMMFLMPIVVYISSFWKIEGIAWGNLTSIIFLFIPAWYFLVKRLCGATLQEYTMSITYPFVISFLIASIIYIILYVLDGNLIHRFSVVIIFGIPLLWILNKKYNQNFYNMLLSILKKSS